MPIFDFACPRCDKRTEVIALRPQDSAVACDECGVQMERVPTAAAFTVKGHSAANGYAAKGAA